MRETFVFWSIVGSLVWVGGMEACTCSNIWIYYDKRNVFLSLFDAYLNIDVFKLYVFL